MSESLKEKIEALLFAMQEMELKKIAEALNEKEDNVLKTLKELKEEYEKRKSAFIISEEGDIWKLTIRQQHVPLVKKILPSEFPKSLLETLAVIAWKNPTLQSEVIKIRGNKAYDHIKELEKRGFIISSAKGKTRELKLTQKFFEYFNISEKEIKNKLKV